jgi:hypothetical protein
MSLPRHLDGGTVLRMPERLAAGGFDLHSLHIFTPLGPP